VKLKSFSSFAMVAALAVSSASCGEFVRNQGHSPSQVVIQSLLGAPGSDPNTAGSPLVSDVESLVTAPDPCTTASPCLTIFNDVGQVTMSIILKDQTGLADPSVLNSVTFTRYRVEYRRADGRNTPGVDVPYPIDSAATFTVPASGNVTAGFELVRNTAKREAPLLGLKCGTAVLNTIADVTFYGRDLAGNEVTATGSIGVNFGDFAPTLKPCR
jgi:hypothetical protein